MNTIQLQKDITLEQYQMVVRVLSDMGIEVKDSNPQHKVSLVHYEKVLKRRQGRLNGTDKCYTWEETKQELLKSL